MQSGQQNQQQAEAHRKAAKFNQMAAEHCERAALAYERGDTEEGQRLAGESERHMNEAKDAMRQTMQQR